MSCASNIRVVSVGVALVVALSTHRGRAQQPPGADDPLAAAEAYRQQLFETIAPSVIFISEGGALGSGFFVDSDGLALTNAHVVGDADKVDVVLHDGQSLTATVVARAGEDVDLALLDVPASSTTPLELTGFDALRVGSWVGSIGHGVGGVWTFTTGMVSNIYPSEKSRPIFQTQIPLNPGASGGPVFDRHGQVVGVVTAGITETNSVNFAIRTDVALDAFDQLADQCRCLTVTAPPGVPIFVDGTVKGNGPKATVHVSAGEHEVFAVIKGKMAKQTVVFPEAKKVQLE